MYIDLRITNEMTVEIKIKFDKWKYDNVFTFLKYSQILTVFTN